MVTCSLKCFNWIIAVVACAIYLLYQPLPACVDDAPADIRLKLYAAPYRRSLGAFLEKLGVMTEVTFHRAIMDWALKRAEDTDTLRTVDTDFDGVPVRVYLPANRHPNGPALMYVHGGGWVVGSVNMYDRLVRTFAEQLQMLTISVEYRLAPEWPYPAAIDDVERAFRYLVKHAAKYDINATRIAMAGDSAGGNLVAALSARLQRANRTNGADSPEAQVKLQILLYPVLQAVNYSTVSMVRNRNDFWLQRHSMRTYVLQYALGKQHNNATLRTLAEQYLHQGCYRLKKSDLDKVYRTQKNEDIRQLILTDNDREYLASLDSQGRELLQQKCTHNPTVLNELHSRLDCLFQEDFSPLFSVSFSKLPPTYIVSCGFDVLRDDSLLYVERLREAGVFFEHSHQHNRCHGYFSILPQNSVAQVRHFLARNALL